MYGCVIDIRWILPLFYFCVLQENFNKCEISIKVARKYFGAFSTEYVDDI